LKNPLKSIQKFVAGGRWEFGDDEFGGEEFGNGGFGKRKRQHERKVMALLLWSIPL
jgi:hypothetical protein